MSNKPVAPPPIRQSFRVSALIPTNVATDARRKKTKVGYSSKVEEDKEEEEEKKKKTVSKYISRVHEL